MITVQIDVDGGGDVDVYTRRVQFLKDELCGRGASEVTLSICTCVAGGMQH